MTLPQGLDAKTFSMMQTGEPYSVYRKTTLGKVVVNVLSPFSNQKEELLLTGNPRTDSSAKVEIWSEMADVFFKRMNTIHFSAGRVIKVDVAPKQVVAEVKAIEQYSDEELREVVNQRYASLQKTVSGVETASTLYRMIELAREMEKSEKIIKVMESKLAAVQQGVQTPD
jgi:hypothetical protein